MRGIGNVLASLGLAALVGGMLFFGAVTAPLVFTHLPLNIAGPFIRAVFPFYYGYMIIASLVGLIGYWLNREVMPALALLLILLVTVWLWLWFIPHLDALRVAGNTAGFNAGHRESVWINGVQMIVALAVLIHTAIRK
ncbi:DUF4149 domain-containing protein [Acidocella sp.]|jgi:hypothetical protein|uniref:DUF4149 domain-containing protein n=1 Tax=Acidocella sp. TaxID=50710 RepID=UPI002F42276A